MSSRWDNNQVVAAGPLGTQLSLKGEKGDRGEKGEKGDKGEKGEKGEPGSAGDLTEVLAQLTILNNLVKAYAQ